MFLQNVPKKNLFVGSAFVIMILAFVEVTFSLLPQFYKLLSSSSISKPFSRYIARYKAEKVSKSQMGSFHYQNMHSWF